MKRDKAALLKAAEVALRDGDLKAFGRLTAEIAGMPKTLERLDQLRKRLRRDRKLH